MWTKEQSYYIGEINKKISELRLTIKNTNTTINKLEEILNEAFYNSKNVPFKKYLDAKELCKYYNENLKKLEQQLIAMKEAREIIMNIEYKEED